LRVGGASYPVSQVGDARISRLELKPSQNQLQVDFVGIDYEPGDSPVWRRWWFDSLALALTLAGVFAAHRYRVAQAVSLERIRTTIATDLHDDIGASLTQIAILSEVALVNANGHGRPGEPIQRVAALPASWWIPWAILCGRSAQRRKVWNP
jgi:hypothetical protein